MNVSFNDPVTILNPNTGENLGEYIGVSIVNVGNRGVIITDWSIILSKRRAKIMTDLQGLLKVSFPNKLDIEESLDLYYDKKFFLAFLQDSLSKKDINAKDRVKFQIMDNTGKKYTVFSAKTVQDYLSKD